MSLIELAESLSGEKGARVTSLRISKETEEVVNLLGKVWGLKMGATVMACVELIWEIITNNGLREDSLKVCELTERLLADTR